MDLYSHALEYMCKIQLETGSWEVYIAAYLHSLLQANLIWYEEFNFKEFQS